MLGDASMGLMYGWTSPQDGLPFPAQITNILLNFPRTSLTATVVTEVNTVVSTTHIVTNMPSEWVPPATNAEGTRVQTITYGQNSTTTLYVITASAVHPQNMTAADQIFQGLPISFNRLANQLSMAGHTVGCGSNRMRDCDNLGSQPDNHAGPPTDWASRPGHWEIQQLDESHRPTQGAIFLPLDMLWATRLASWDCWIR